MFAGLGPCFVFLAGRGDSALGRFVQPDTLIPEAAQGTQAWDRYAYANNSPIKYSDPSGHFVVLGTMLGGAALGAVAGLAIYSANVAFSSNEWNMGEAISAVGVGAVGGFLIGTGVGAAAGAASLAAIGAGAGVIGGQAGYTATAGAGYDTGNMVLSAAVSGAAGAITGGTITAGTVIGTNAVVLSGVVNGTANTSGYALTTLNSGGKLSPGIAATQFVMGSAIGAYSGSALADDAAQAMLWMNAAQNKFATNYLGLSVNAMKFAARGHLFQHTETQFARTLLENVIQSYGLQE